MDVFRCDNRLLDPTTASAAGANRYANVVKNVRFADGDGDCERAAQRGDTGSGGRELPRVSTEGRFLARAVS